MGFLSFFKEKKALSDKIVVYSAKFDIPEPTRSLLWVTSENPQKASNPMGIKISFDLNSGSVEMDQGKNYFGEPSLIWTKLPVKPNNDLEKSPMYYPSYIGLSPAQRFQYINWLRDVSQPTNLSYVFLYYYGLERQLLIGDYNLSLSEILKLIKYHDKNKFRFYVIGPIIAASLFRKQYDIFEKAPFLLNEVSNEALVARVFHNISLRASDLINLSSKVGFTNKRYIKNNPDLFEEELSKNLIHYKNEFGGLLESINLKTIRYEEYPIFLNLSIPDEYRNTKIPQILEDEKFKRTIYDLLSKTHEAVKNTKKDHRVDSLQNVSRPRKSVNQ